MAHQRVCANTPALPPEQWAEAYDFLLIAHDALGDHPKDFDGKYLDNAVMHARMALQILHRASAEKH